MTNEQHLKIKEMRAAGISYAIIASYLKVCPNTLRKQIKNYELELQTTE